MRLQRFRAQGFKNLRQPITLDELGPVNVLAGDTNAGKSNLLQAMGLFFGLLANRLRITGRLHAAMDEPVPAELPWIGEPLDRAFHIEAPAPIELEATVLLDEGESREAGIAQDASEGALAIEIGLRLEATLEGACYHVSRFCRRGGDEALDRALLDGASGDAQHELAPADHVSRLVTERRLSRAGDEAPRYALVRANRRLAASAHEPAGGVIPADLALALYDAREALDRGQYQRWERFLALMERFTDVLGPGKPVVLFDRHRGQASLALESAHTRIPLSTMGAGVQQLAALLGHILMSHASIVAIEDPELNLSLGVQERLATILAELTTAGWGPSQLMLSTHAPAFQRESNVYTVRSTERGPVIERTAGTDQA